MKSQSNSQELDTILGRNAAERCCKHGDINPNLANEKAKAKLLELALSCKSEKIKGRASMFKPPKVSEMDYREQTGYNFGYADGFNAAIDTMERNILEAFS